jgi:methionine sulfoxide reductase heme-binding subunit
MPNPFHYTFWLASRAAGIVGLIALGAVAILGLVNALRLVDVRTAARLRPYHERLAITGLACIAAHGLLLLGDSYLRPSITQLTVPFTMSYRPLWTGLGIIAFYCLAVFGLSFYQRRRIGAKRWRSAHRFASVAFVLGLIHALMAGTDARSPLLLGIIIFLAAAVLVMGGMRALGLPAKKPRNSAPQQGSRTPAVQ